MARVHFLLSASMVNARDVAIGMYYYSDKRRSILAYTSSEALHSLITERGHTVLVTTEGLHFGLSDTLPDMFLKRARTLGVVRYLAGLDPDFLPFVGLPLLVRSSTVSYKRIPAITR